MRNELIPKVLKEYRKRNHYSVKDVSIRLMEHDIDVAPKTIYGWESGQAQPTADTLLLLCEIYKIPDILKFKKLLWLSYLTYFRPSINSDYMGKYG